MVKYLPFAEIKAAVPIERVMQLTGLPLKQQGSSFRCECPVHKGGKRSLVVTPGEPDQKGDAGVFFCHAAEEGGDRIGLLAHVRESGQYAAVRELAEAFCPELLGAGTQKAEKPAGKRAAKPASPGAKTGDEPATVSSTIPEEEKEEQGSGRRGFQPLPYLQFDHPAVSALDLSPEVAEALGIGFAPRGLHRGRIAVPVRLADGRIAGYLSFEGNVKLPPQWHL